MNRHAYIVAAFVAVGVATGCSAFRPVAPLDDDERTELTALRQTLGGRPVVLVAGPTTKRDAFIEFAGAVREAGVPIGPTLDEPSSLRIEVDGPLQPLDEIARMEGNVFFFLVTLGLWPQHTNDAEEWRFRIADAGRDATLASATTRPSYFGWIGGPLALWPGWSYGGVNRVPAESPDERSNRRDRAVLELARKLAEFVRAPDSTSGTR